MSTSSHQGLQTFLSEGHINYYKTVRGLDTMRNVIVSGYITLFPINKFSVSVLFFIIDQMASRNWWNRFAGRIWPAGRSLETPELNDGCFVQPLQHSRIELFRPHSTNMAFQIRLIRSFCVYIAYVFALVADGVAVLIPYMAPFAVQARSCVCILE